MGFLGAFVEPESPRPWNMAGVSSRKSSLRPEEVYDMTSDAAAKYPESVWAPPRNISKSPASDHYPAPYEFKKRELIAACQQGMQMNGMGGRYPRPWTVDDEPTDFMAFPILPGKRLWDDGEPGRFRIVYHKYDGTFHRLVMHRYTTPLAGREKNVGLGFTLVGDSWDKSPRSSRSAPSPTQKVVKPHSITSSHDSYSECHPLRQNPVFKSVPWCPDDVGRSAWNSPDFAIDSGTVFPEKDMPPRLNSVPLLPSSIYDPPPLVKVKSAPGTLRRPSCGWPLPDNQPLHDDFRTSLVKSPPTAMLKPRVNDTPSLPPLDTNLAAGPGPIVPSQLNTVPSPEISQDDELALAFPKELQLPYQLPTPIFDEHELFFKTPGSSAAPTPLADWINEFMNPPPEESPRSSVESSPALEQSLSHSPPQKHMLPLRRDEMVPDALDLQTSPATAPTPASPSIFSSAKSPPVGRDGYDSRLPRSPLATSESFSNIVRPIVAQQSPIVKHAPFESPMMKSPPTKSPRPFSAMSPPQSRFSMQSPTRGYDPRLPLKSPRVSSGGFPFNSGSPVVLGQETPPLRSSPAVGMHSPNPAKSSPLMRSGARCRRSSPIPHIIVWADQPDMRRASHAPLTCVI